MDNKGDNKFIKGIYNYCDRWCEKCTHTSHCLVYAREQKSNIDSDDLDLQNEKFWQEIENSLKEAFTLLEKIAQEQNIDLDNSAEAGFGNNRKDTERHPASVQAKNYISSVNNWFEKAEPHLESRGLEIQQKAEFGISKNLEEEVQDLNDLLEIIRWYQHFIYAKTMRAIQSKIKMDDFQKVPIQKDANGSAKIALIGVDRSIGAWMELLNEFPPLEDTTLAILVELKKIKDSLLNSFPKAYKFQRPGFDQ